MSGASPSRELVKLWVRHQSSVAAYIGVAVTDFAEAEELLQETAAQIFEHTDRFDESRPFLPWCLGVAKNVVLMHRRRRARDRHVFNHQAMENLSTAFQEIAENKESLPRVLSNCLGKLSGRSREICRLRYEQDLQPQEIANQLGSTSAVMSSTLYRIRERLKSCIELHLKTEEMQ